MDGANAAAAGALALLPPEPVYSSPHLDDAYAADDSFSPRAMRPLYGATRALTELLLPYDAAPPGVLEVLPGGTVELRPPLSEAALSLLAHYATPLALAALALALAAALPLAGLCVLCARCCCPPPPPPPPRGRRARRRAACRRAMLGLALAVVATAMLFGVVCAFVTNEYMQEGSEALPQRLRVATRDAHLYLNNTRHHLSHLLVTNFHEFRDNLEHSLNMTGRLIVTGLKTLSNATIFNEVANLTRMLDSTHQDLLSLQNLTNDAHNAARVLDKELKDLRARIKTLHSRCKDEEQCYAALNASEAATDADFLQLTTAAEAALGGGAARDAAEQAAAAAGPLRRAVEEAEAALNDVARRVDARVAEAAPPLRKALADLGTAVADYDTELARALRNVSAALDGEATPAIATLDQWVRRYSRYRYYADAGASAALLLVVLLLALGLLFGCCARSDGAGDCCAGGRSTGARCLRLAVAAMLLLGCVLAVAATVHLIAGLLGVQAACAPLRPPRPAPLLALAAARLAPPSAPRDGARLAHALRRCHANASAVAVLAPSRNASNLMALADQPALRELLASEVKAAAAPGGVRVTLLDRNARDALRDLAAGAGEAAERAAAAANALAAAATAADPSGPAQRLDAAPAPPALRTELRALAEDLRRLKRGSLQELRIRAQALNATAARVRERLRMGRSDARLAADAAVAQLDAAELKLKQDGDQLMATLGEQLGKQLEERLRFHLKRVVTFLEGPVGACAPLSRAVNASLVAVCDEVLLPVNGWWVGCGLCLLLFIPALILASCLATQYRRPRADHYIPAGPDTEYLYDAYSDRDNIPLASAGKKRGAARGRGLERGHHEHTAHDAFQDTAGAAAAAYDLRAHDARFSDMAPKHWDLQSGAPPPRYLGPEYERPPPYYYPGPDSCGGRR